MLSRTAEAFFWMGRYIERAEYTARTANVHQQVLLEHPDPAYQADTWARLLDMSGDLLAYQERHGRLDSRSALEYLAVDPGNPNSLVSCVAAARENARTIQDQLSSEVWYHINRFYLEVSGLSRQDFWADSHGILRHVRDTGYTLSGVISHTMLHDERLAFFRMGRDIERAGRTLRLLLTPALLEATAEPGGISEFQERVAVLKSASAYEAFRKTYRGGLDAVKIVEFLLLSDRFPRSVRFSARNLRAMLGLVTSGHSDGRSEPERLTGQFAADLEYVSLADVIANGIETYLQGLVTRVAHLSDCYGRAYFRYTDSPGVPTAILPQRRRPFPRPEAPTTVVQAILRVRHDFTYRYSAPVEHVRTIVRLTPPQRYGRQRLLDVKWVLEPQGDFRQHVDAFGNPVWQLDHAHIDQELKGSIEMLVENHAVYHAEGALALRGIDPDDEEGIAGPAEYGSLTSLVDTSEALLAIAQRARAEHAAPMARVEVLLKEVHGRMRFETGLTTVQTTASEAFGLGRGVCQDFAHVMLSLCRGAGVSARYVSGYLPAEGVMHAWVEVLIDDPSTGQARWIAYDPTHGRRVDETYVTVAVGRDYRDIAPTSGFYSGSAENVLTVRVSTRIEQRHPLAKTVGTSPLRGVTLDQWDDPQPAQQ
jgi:uncharacterized alpha-E superfamily protein/transglutaminase-like putative cysteine protease